MVAENDMDKAAALSMQLIATRFDLYAIEL